MTSAAPNRTLWRTALTFWRFEPRDTSASFARVLHRWCLLFFVVFALLLVYLVILFFLRRADVEADALARGHRRLAAVTDRLEGLFSRVTSLGRALAADIESGALEKEAILQRIQEDAKKEPLLLGIGVAYEPHLYSTKQRFFRPFFDARSNEIVPTDEKTDYTDLAQFDGFRWHIEPALRQKPTWVVGLGGLAKTAFVNLGVPFFERVDGKRGRLLGVVHLTLGSQSLTYLLNKQYVGRLGSGYLVDRHGSLLAHPNPEAVNDRRTLQELALLVDDGDLLTVAGRMASGDSGVHRSVDPETGEAVLHFHQRIPKTEFSVGMTVFRYELISHATELRRRKILIALTVLALLMCSTVLATRAYHFEPAALWSVAMVFTSAMLAVMLFVWTLFLARSPKTLEAQERATGGPQSYSIDDSGSLLDLEARLRERAKKFGHEPPIVIPTGVFVEAIEFEGANNVKLAGVVWQRYHINDHKEVERGFVFPQVAPDPEAVSIEKVSTRQQGETEVVTWQFRVVLRLELDYSRYPFDRQRIAARIQPIQTGKNVLFVPDLDAYQLVNTHKKPGLSEELVLPGWQIEGSFFGFEEVRHNTNFGVDRKSRNDTPPRLQFHILAKRDILTPFLSHAFPIVVVSALLYAVLSSTSSDQDRLSLSGFSTFGVLETCGAFFFAIIFVHLDMRKSLDTDSITYLECLHLLLYLVLLLVALDALLFNSSKSPFLIRYEENFLPKVLYWPMLVGSSLVVTLLFFY